MRRKTSLVIVFMVVMMAVSSACITGESNKTPSTSSLSTADETMTSQSSSHSTSSTPLTTTSSSSYIPSSTSATHSTHETTPAPAEPFLESIEAISNYALTMRTYLNVSAVVESSGVVRMENVSLVSNTSAVFDISSNGMEMNISAYTFPAGGRSFTEIVLVGDTAYVRSFGNWSVLHRGDEGFLPIFNTFTHNPISMVLDAIRSGSCVVVGTPENGSVVCSGDEVLSQAVLLAVGAPSGSKVEVHSGEIELDFMNGQPVKGHLNVSFKISSSSSVQLTQEGLLRQEFTVREINKGEKVKPPSIG